MLNPCRCARSGFIAVLALALFGVGMDASYGATRGRRSRGARRQLSEAEKQDYQASAMVRKGLEYLEQNLEERGLKLLQDVPRMYPKSGVRFSAYLALGKYLGSKRKFEEAVKTLKEVEQSEDLDEQAEALYQTGICFYELNQFSQAFAVLRRVNNDYPWSVFANEAYYYIGLCHFKLGRWAKAVEALKMVGTSVPPKDKLPGEQAGMYKAEAGQRFFIRIYDKDLVVLQQLGERLSVDVKSKSGDAEVVVLEKLDKLGEYYIGALLSAPGTPKPQDKQLQVRAGDVVKVTYSDRNTSAGERNVIALAEARLVSTAAVGFTDGAFKDYVNGVYGAEDCFMRVRDLDLDTSSQRDKVRVKVYTEYRVQQEGEENEITRFGVDLEEEPEFAERDAVLLELEETEPHSGVFVGTKVPELLTEGAEPSKSDNVLHAMANDRIIMVYEDEKHMLSNEAREVKAVARVVTGDHGDVKVTHTQAKTIEHEAKKNLIEAKLYLRLSEIFKDVGLEKKAGDKAGAGLERVEKVIGFFMKGEAIDRTIVEEAFSVKWELLLVQNKLSEAIAVCGQLTKLFPTTTLVDKALFTIGMAKKEAQDFQEAINIFGSVLRLPKSEYKAESQFRIGEVYEEQASATSRDGKPNPQMLASALRAYQSCADNHPSSPFAGEALEKIADFYITSKDYSRAIELMERIFLEHPDATWLDKMLLKWGIAAYRLRDYQQSYDKFNQCLMEYPASSSAEKARKFLKAVARKLGK